MDQAVITIVRQQVQSEVEQQMRRTSTDVARIKGEMAARGVFQSSMTLTRITECSVLAARDRARVVGEVVSRVVNSAGVEFSDDLAAGLKQLLDSTVGFGDLPGHVQNVVRIIQNERVTDAAFAEVNQAIQSAKAGLNSEVELLVLSLKNARTAATQTVPPTFQIFAPVGAIQTAPGSVANVSQAIDPGAKEMIDRALATIEEALRRTDAGQGSAKVELVEVVAEARAEVAKEIPNRMRLRSLLTSTGEAISAIANLKPAYELLKQGIAALGLTLP